MIWRPLIKVFAVTLALTGCATVRPLGSVAKRTTDPQTSRNDVRVDTSSREIGKIRRLAWVAYSADFLCESSCPFTLEERKKIAAQVAEKSFGAFDQEIRKALGEGRSVLPVGEVTAGSAIKMAVRTDSFRSTVNRWLERMGLSRSREVSESARGLKTLNPSEIGWAGGESLAAIGQSLAVDGVLVGRLEISVVDKKERHLAVRGPMIWIFSSTTAHPVVVAGLRPSWTLEPIGKAEYDWGGLAAMAEGYSRRVVQEMR